MNDATNKATERHAFLVKAARLIVAQVRASQGFTIACHELAFDLQEQGRKVGKRFTFGDCERAAKEALS